MRDEIRPSSEIDAYCTKCRMVTNHRVVAIHDGVIKRVICLTCDGQHNYRPPPGQKAVKTGRAKRIKKDLRRSRTVMPEAFEKWLAMKETLVDDPRPYDMSGDFQVDEAIRHGTFGLGFVTKILSDRKMEVMFEKEIKTLAMNYQRK